MFSFFKIIYLRGRVINKRVRKKEIFHLQIYFPLATKAKVGLDSDQELFHVSHTGGTGPSTLPTSIAFPGTSSESWL